MDKGKIYVVVGLQYGDEGKGKITATLPRIYDIACGVRGGVGPNAGHSVTLDSGGSVEFRTLPEVAIYDKTKLAIGPGTLIDPQVLEKEIIELEKAGVKNPLERLVIDSHCGIVEPRHREMEGGYLQKEIGSMVSGCGAKSMERIGRDPTKWLYPRDIAYLRNNIGDVPSTLYSLIMNGKNIVVSGTQGFGLSLFHGTYPYVTSKDTTASQFLADAGIGPGWDIVVIGCIKPYTTRAGTGPMPEKDKKTENVTEQEIRPGVVIGSDRRVGAFDRELVKQAARANGIGHGTNSFIAITNVDRIWPANRGAKILNSLSLEARMFINEVENLCEAPVGLISVGPKLSDYIIKK